jgi:hypothetical protein
LAFFTIPHQLKLLGLPERRISGRALSALGTAVRHTPARGPLAQLLRSDLRIERARALGSDARAELPLTTAPLRCLLAHCSGPPVARRRLPHPVQRYDRPARSARRVFDFS